HGLRWVQPDAPLAHPLDDGSAVVLERSLAETVAALEGDGPAYRRLVEPLVRGGPGFVADLLGPLRVPRSPLRLARFGALGGLPVTALSRFFGSQRTRAVLAGMAAHGMIRLDRPPSAGFGLMLAFLAHHVGWPMAVGGSRRIADALASHLRELGGTIETGHRVESLREVDGARVVLLDVTPRQLIAIAGDRMPAGYRRKLERYRYGPGVFKVDWALSEPVPWKADACSRAGTVHLGGTMAEIAASELAVAQGRHHERPYLIVSQQSLFDETRAPRGQHTLWAYCHVPNGSEVDMTDRIEAQIERYAPGFRDTVLARHIMSSSDLERHNPNCIGGDINGGVQDLFQFFNRPAGLVAPYRTAMAGVYLCSSSTPPGGGVHGMCGCHAARLALRDLGANRPPNGSEAE
ncbi:MAG: phytoene desaturase family protein, partial [Nitriliruptorales bacterium]